MPRLGTILLRAGALTEESVNRALAVQGFAGGRLGTLLIERGSASEDDIGRALSEQHGCDYVPWSVLGAIGPNVIAALPAKFAIRHSAVPVEIGEGYIKIAVRDPANLRILDELFFVTGKKVVPAVAPEVRLYQALEKYYGERRTPRFAILAEKLSRPTAPSVIKKPLPPPPDFSTNPRELPPGLAPSTEGTSLIEAWRVPDEPPVGWGGLPQPPPSSAEEPETIAWEEVPPTPSWPGAPPASPGARRSPDLPERVSPAPTRLPERPVRSAEKGAWRQTAPPGPRPVTPRLVPAGSSPDTADLQRILSAPGRDQIFETVVECLSRRFRKCAVFAARREGVAGWSGAGERVDAPPSRASLVRAVDLLERPDEPVLLPRPVAAPPPPRRARGGARGLAGGVPGPARTDERQDSGFFLCGVRSRRRRDSRRPDLRPGAGRRHRGGPRGLHPTEEKAGYIIQDNPGGGMIKADIVDRVVDLAQIPRAKAATAVETVIEAMRSALGAGDRIELRGFGVFQVKRRKRGIGRNPKTGVEVSIPPGNTIRFKPGKDLRDLP
jgi:DNA-binding protein HU-beta